MKAQIIRYGKSIDEYKVTDFEGMTDTEIIDACDRNNWGGNVFKFTDGTAKVQVYKD